MYGREPNLSTALKFQVPVSKFPIFVTDYGNALEEELEYAWTLAKKNLEASQKQQKKYYDKKAKSCELKVVMLKVQPNFKLDRQLQGPFKIVSQAATNAIIQEKNDKSERQLL